MSALHVLLSSVKCFPYRGVRLQPSNVHHTCRYASHAGLYLAARVRRVSCLLVVIALWYFQLDLNSAPQNLVAWPTEPILKPTRAIIPPAFGVDISPIVWVMICSLVHEILLGQQGILNLMSNK